MKYNRIGILFFVTMLIALLTSCTAERELAREFIKTKKDIPILLLSTDRLILTNEKLKKITNFDSLKVATQDSLWTTKTLYLDSVNDAKLLSLFYEKFKTELQYYGFKVFTQDSIDNFNAIETSKYTLNLAQTEISEDDYIYRDEEAFYNSLVYYHDNVINILKLNFWFEFSASVFKNEKVFYSEFPISDKLESRFVLDNESDNVSYQYRITPIALDNIYQLTDYSAQRSANYFFNYLMNKYVKENLPTDIVAPKYFSYDYNTGFLFNNENDKFVELDSK